MDGEYIRQANANIQADVLGRFVFMGPAFPSQLTLFFQLNDALPMDAALAQRIRSLDDVEMFAEKLTDVTREMSMLFQRPPLKNHVYILVQLPPPSES